MVKYIMSLFESAKEFNIKYDKRFRIDPNDIAVPDIFAGRELYNFGIFDVRDEETSLSCGYYYFDGEKVSYEEFRIDAQRMNQSQKNAFEFVVRLGILHPLIAKDLVCHAVMKPDTRPIELFEDYFGKEWPKFEEMFSASSISANIAGVSPFGNVLLIAEALTKDGEFEEALTNIIAIRRHIYNQVYSLIGDKEAVALRRQARIQRRELTPQQFEGYRNEIESGMQFLTKFKSNMIAYLHDGRGDLGNVPKANPILNFHRIVFKKNYEDGQDFVYDFESYNPEGVLTMEGQRDSPYPIYEVHEISDGRRLPIFRYSLCPEFQFAWIDFMG